MLTVPARYWFVTCSSASAAALSAQRLDEAALGQLAWRAIGPAVSIISFLFIVGVYAIELLVCAIQAYVFALLTTLYLNDAINLH